MPVQNIANLFFFTLLTCSGAVGVQVCSLTDVRLVLSTGHRVRLTRQCLSLTRTTLDVRRRSAPSTCAQLFFCTA